MTPTQEAPGAATLPAVAAAPGERPAARTGTGAAGSSPEPRPRIVVFTSLFPHPGDPGAGVFIRERMFRVGARVPLVVVAPQPWFPLQGLLRLVRPGYRIPAPRFERQQGFEVHRPRFLALPGVGRRFDGAAMAACSFGTLRRLVREFRPDLIDAHFAWPSGYAATLLGRRLGLPVTITLRGTEPGHLADRALRPRLVRAFAAATRLIAVSDSLRRVAVAAGASLAKVEVVGNGVDVDKFQAIPRSEARRALGLPAGAPVLVSVGGLVERKGFHRVIECLPGLRARHPGLRYLVVGGASPEGDMGAELRAQVARLGLADCVTFTGPLAPERLHVPLSAADVFVLATRNEGWANVFLEAMACGLPVVTTAVGGNAEVVCRPELGRIVPFGDARALAAALADALASPWDRAAIVAHARANAWDGRIDALLGILRGAAAPAAGEGDRA